MLLKVRIVDTIVGREEEWEGIVRGGGGFRDAANGLFLNLGTGTRVCSVCENVLSCHL